MNQLPTWLFILTAIFIFRVVGQFLQLWFNVPLLPSFEQWYSGAIPYPYLLAIQFFIIFWMLRISLKIKNIVIKPNRKLGNFLEVIAWIYLIVMFVRFVISVTGMLEYTWFQRPIPSFFHMVLASYILLVAHYHKTKNHLFR